MATKKEIRNVNIIVNGKEVRNNIKNIAGAYKKAKNELAKLTIGSEQYNRKLQEVKKLKGVLNDHNKQLGFIQSSWQKMKSGLTALLPMLSLGTLVAGTKRLYDFIKGLKESRAEVKKLSDLTGSGLNKATARATALAETYNKDFNKVLEATNNLSKQMGITFDESFDLIEKGFQAGADINGEFLENLREYPGFFKEADYTAEQFISTITKQTKQGIFSDKGVDAIKEATLSLREMTEPTKDALRALEIDSEELTQKISSGQMKMSEAIAMISRRMAELPEQSQAVGMALADIFKGAGEDAGMQFISTLGEVNTGLEEMIDNNDDLVIAQQNNLIATTELNEAYLRMFGEGSNLRKSWSSFKAQFAKDLNTMSTIATDEGLNIMQKISLLLNPEFGRDVAENIQREEQAKEEEQAYKLLNKQLVLMAENLGIEADLTNLTNQEIQELIDKKKAQIEAERQLKREQEKRRAEEEAAREKERKEEEKARKEAEAAEQKLADTIAKIRQQLHLDTLTKQAAEIQEVKYKYDKLIEEAEGHKDKIAELEELRGQEIAAINAKYEEEKVKKRAEVEQKIQEMLLGGKEKEKYLVAQKYQELIKMAEKFGFDTSELFEKMNEELAKIDEDYATEGGSNNLLAKALGLDDEGWEKLEERFGEIVLYAREAMNAWDAYNQLKRNQDEAEMQRFEKNMDAKKMRLEKQLERGIISQEEYAKKSEQIDQQLDREKAKLMKEQSEREKNAAYFNAVVSTAAAIIGFMGDPGGWAGVALSALAAITGALQISAISAEPVPTYEQGGRIKKEGLIYAGEGDKEEGILSNRMLTDPNYGPMANYLLDVQDGKRPAMPTTATEMPDAGAVSTAMDYNNFKRTGGQYSQPVVNNTYVTNTSAEDSNTMRELLEEQRRMNQFLSDPVNRQAYINYDKQKESDEEMELLNRYNKF